MLISALCDYYDLLASKGDVLPDGYSKVGIHSIIHLTRDGEIAYISDFRDAPPASAKGKAAEKMAPKDMFMPKRESTTKTVAEFIDHRAKYIFGLVSTNSGLDATNVNAINSHKAFVERHLEITEGIHSDLVDAFRKFVGNWNPEQQKENPLLLGLGRHFGEEGFAFCLEDNMDLLLHEDEQIKSRWEEFLKQKNQEEKKVQAQCAILGEKLPIAQTHIAIKGILGGKPLKFLVCFNKKAYESYGKKQSANSNISIAAMKKYTEVLNELLKNEETHNLLGDMTIVQWAMSTDHKYEEMVQEITFGKFKETLGEDDTQEYLMKLLAEARDGEINFSRLKTKDIDPNVEFYVAGFKANASRISVKFVYRKRFGELLQNIAQHQADMQMSEDAKPVPMWKIIEALELPNSSDGKLDPGLYSKIFDAMIQGYLYPNQLLYTVLQRIKSESHKIKEKEKKSTKGKRKMSAIEKSRIRAGLIKAYLNRYFRITNQKEVMTMALDENNHAPAYLCGRLFAVLEQLQQRVSGGNLNRTIKDSYFTLACTRPVIAFSRLDALSVHHLAKTKYPKYWNDLKAEIISHLDGNFPQSLSLMEQGEFIVGYHQQYQSMISNYNKSNKKGEETNE